MSHLSVSGSSIDDSFNDLDYDNPNSPIEVSDFENISEYENLINNEVTLTEKILEFDTDTECNYYVNVGYNDNVQVVDDSNNEDRSEDDSNVRRGKKKVPKIYKWKRNMSKNANSEGLKHIIIREKHVMPRISGPDCKCNKKIFTKVTNKERSIILDLFNKIAQKERQDTYLACLIKVHTVIRHKPKNNNKPKTCSCFYKVRISCNK